MTSSPVNVLSLEKTQSNLLLHKTTLLMRPMPMPVMTCWVVVRKPLRLLLRRRLLDSSRLSRP